MDVKELFARYEVEYNMASLQEVVDLHKNQKKDDETWNYEFVTLIAFGLRNNIKFEILDLFIAKCAVRLLHNYENTEAMCKEIDFAFESECESHQKTVETSSAPN